MMLRALGEFTDTRRVARVSRLEKLSDPILLELFDGSAAASGSISHHLPLDVSAPEGPPHQVDFLITNLHPTARIVLGLPWLQQHNPDIDWTTGQVKFKTAPAEPTRASRKSVGRSPV